VKPLLLDQSFLAGVGNIYADEALWRARVHPARPAHGLSGAEGDRLRESLRCTLRRAIRLGGTSLGHGETNFRGAGLRPGRNQLRLAAYGRAGKACPRCGTVIEKMVLAQRGTHFCPRCQPAARGRAHAGAGRTR
jgi:formamidopyrimidine-DNA glycosylase